jgi:hypothetical protein
MKPDPAEYKGVIRKLLDKTRQGKVQWEQGDFTNSFRCSLPSSDADSFYFLVSHSSGSNFEPEAFRLRMSDQRENVILAASANDLPTSSQEEELSQMIEEIYELARRQALKIEQKLDLASTLLDRI